LMVSVLHDCAFNDGTVVRRSASRKENRPGRKADASGLAGRQLHAHAKLDRPLVARVLHAHVNLSGRVIDL
jgi:hypothetical protein